jgi:hypothetical protein
MNFQTLFLYQEMFPHWFSPYVSRQRISDFRVGNRVMNLNSTLRQYVPFGLRGTVVGKTEDFVIVLFDEQFLQGTDINGHCQNYRGAKVAPYYMMNLSRSFAQLAKEAKNFNVLKKYQEKPKKGEVEFEDLLPGDEAAERKAVRETEARPMHGSSSAVDEKDEVPAEKKPKQRKERPLKKQESEEMKASEKVLKKASNFDIDAPVYVPKKQQQASSIW